MTSRAGRIDRRCARGAAGFTLFELIIVLLILAIASFFTVPAMQSGWESRQVRQGTRMLAGVMRSLRERAIRQGVDQELILEPDGATIHFGDQTRTMPTSIEIEGVRGGMADEEGRVRVRFYPNGGATGFGLLVSGPSEAGLKFAIDVDPLLGAVRVRDTAG